MAVLARFTGMFLSDLCLCAKAYINGANSVCLCRASYGQCDATCVCLSVCMPACFCGLNPRTVPQLILNKFRARHGNRGSVLGLNVPSFVLWIPPVSIAAQTRLSESRRHNYVTEL